jgi:hypothetical protein
MFAVVLCCLLVSSVQAISRDVEAEILNLEQSLSREFKVDVGELEEGLNDDCDTALDAQMFGDDLPKWASVLLDVATGDVGSAFVSLTATSAVSIKKNPDDIIKKCVEKLDQLAQNAQFQDLARGFISWIPFGEDVLNIANATKEVAQTGGNVGVIAGNIGTRAASGAGDTAYTIATLGIPWLVGTVTEVIADTVAKFTHEGVGQAKACSLCYLAAMAWKVRDSHGNTGNCMHADNLKVVHPTTSVPICFPKNSATTHLSSKYIYDSLQEMVWGVQLTKNIAGFVKRPVDKSISTIKKLVSPSPFQRAVVLAGRPQMVHFLMDQFWPAMNRHNDVITTNVAVKSKGDH